MSERRLMTIPGPTIFDPSVLRSLSIGHLSHTSKEFVKIFSEVLAKLRKLLYVDDEYKVVVLAGSGTLAMETAISNLIEKDDNVLVVSNGVFGDRMRDLLERYPVNIDIIRVKEPGETVPIRMIREKLDEKDYSMITVTHVDTSTAVRQNIAEIGELVRDRETLLIVDGVCSVGGEEIKMDDWGLDVVLTGSQKALGVPTGLAVLWFSEKAQRRLVETGSLYAPYYMDLNKWIKVMDSYENLKPAYFATPSVNLIVGLHRSLELMEEEGFEKRFKRHRIISHAFREGVKAMGLEILPRNEEIAASTVTAIYLPRNIDLNSFRGEMLKRNVMVAGGLYPNIKSKYFRVGHMGPINSNDIVAVTCAIERSLKILGYNLELGVGVSKVQEILYKNNF